MTDERPNGAPAAPPTGMVQVEVIDMARRVVNLPVMTPQGAQAIPVPFVAART
jgi:hypothetical protein